MAAKLTTWLHRVTSNLALNYSQRVQQRHVYDDGLVEFIVDSAVSDEPVNEDENTAVLDALKALPDNQRAVMAFRFYQDTSVKDIAKIMGLSAKAVESLIGRAKQQLKARLGGRE